METKKLFKICLIDSQDRENEITLGYSDGRLVMVAINPQDDHTGEQTAGVITWLADKAFNPAELIAFARKKSYKLEDITAEEPVPTFDAFWEAYAHKVSKKEAQDRWAKLKDDDKRKALAYIKTYQSECARTGVFKMYPKTYLHKQVWQV
jgi:hypothetical protein